jgi:predicted protein tyrosine phosphatase
MNRLANCKNPFQGTAKKVLTVCSAGLLRSPTAAKVLSETYGFNCRAAGIVEEYALVPVTEVLIFWADEIVFMQQEHLDMFTDEFQHLSVADSIIQEGRFQVLNIPDNFSWMDEDLQDYILQKYDEKKT